MRKISFILLICSLFFGLPVSTFAEQNLLALPVTEPPIIDGIANEPFWQNAPAITSFDEASQIAVKMKAVYTDTEIFIQVSFPDSDESRTHKSWSWDQGREIYTVGHDREDIFILKWNIEPQPVDLSIFSANAYKADIWYWKACRTDGTGFADDKSHIFSPAEDRDATKIVSSSGETMYLLRTADAGESAYRIDLISEYQGDILPRYILQKPTGSRGDVRAKGTWRNGKWTIEFGRKLVTGDPGDIQITPDKKYLFGISRYEIAGRKPNVKLSDPLYGTGDVNETLWLEFMNMQ
jgi:hypothetical protein